MHRPARKNQQALDAHCLDSAVIPRRSDSRPGAAPHHSKHAIRSKKRALRPAMVSYAKFDKLARELDTESTNPTDGTWTKRRQDDFYLDPAVRDREAKTLAACAPLGSAVELDGLVKQPFYNGRKGLVVSGRLCKGERIAVELTEDKYDNRVLLVKTTQVTHCLLEKAPSRIELLKPRAMEVAGNVWIGDACSADVVAGGSHIPEALKWPPFAALVLLSLIHI